MMDNLQIKKTIADPEIYKQTRHRDQQYKRIAALLLVLSADKCAQILKGLSTEEGRGVITAITGMDRLSEKEVQRLLEEFGYYPDKTSPDPAGGEAKARELLLYAFGETKGNELCRLWLTEI